MPLIVLDSSAALILCNIIGWALVSWGSSRITWHYPERFLNPNAFMFRTRPWEDNGWIYRRILRVHRWKEHLPEDVILFPAGFPKRRLRGTDPDYLERFILETCRAELTHWIPLVAWPLFWIFNPLRVMPFMLLYALLSNLPCVIVQRYNRPRLLRALRKRRYRHSEIPRKRVG